MTAPTRSLAQGRSLVTANGRRGVVGDLLGAGGQGEVYSVMVEGLPLALKWYHLHYADIDTGLRRRLETAVRRGAPTGDFLWPIDLVSIPGEPSFGYLMPLRPDRYTSIRDLIAPPPQRLDLGLAQRGAICLQLAESFLELHAAGFCYQDINFGNIFLDPDTVRILICDNDNVNIDGADASIYGTRKFMAPEVVRREILPNSRTDLFSMSVLFFYILFGWHPLDGRREHEMAVMNAEGETALYGAAPLFLFDPVDDANGPVEGFHDPLVLRWKSLSASLRALFERAFGPGLHQPSARVLETEWRTALSALTDTAGACAHCGFEQLHGTGPACLACGTAIAWPPAFRLGTRLVLLNEGRTFSFAARGDRTAPDARVETHPQRADLRGIRNIGGTDWQATMPDASAYRVAPGQTVRIVPGAQITSGMIRGDIIALQTEQAA